MNFINFYLVPTARSNVVSFQLFNILVFYFKLNSTAIQIFIGDTSEKLRYVLFSRDFIAVHV